MNEMAIKMRTIVGAAVFCLAMTVGKGVVLTNYSDVCGHVKYQSSTYTSGQSVFENFYDTFGGEQIWRGVVEFGIAAFPTNPQSPIRLIMKVTVSASGDTNYAFNLVSYTNDSANGVVNTNDYGCAATLVGTLCSNLLPVVGQVFTSDVTAVVQAARTNGLTNIGFRVQTNPDSSSSLRLQFNDAQSGEGTRLEWTPTLPVINNNAGASSVTTNAATLNGVLIATGAAPAYVVVYWGTNDGGTNISGWNTTNAVGWRDEGSFSTNVVALTTNTLYYYRCFASNSYGLAWAAESTNFTTLSPGPPGNLQFSAAATSVAENVGSVILVVSRTGGSNGIVSVNYATSNGTAAAGTEYTATNGTLTWANNDAASKTVTVAIVDNSEYYGTNKTFLVILTNAVSATLGAPATNTVTIMENDPVPVPGTLQFSAATASVAENAGNVTLVVIRSGGSDGTASVAYATANGTASSGSDYLTASGTLTWLDGDASNKTVTVEIQDDNVYQGDKNFSVNLSNAGGATLGSPATATVTITENESPPGSPTDVAATDGTFSDRIRVTWSPVAGVSYYQIWGGTNLDQLTLLKQQFILSGLRYDDTNAKPLVTYYYRVKSSNDVGVSSFSAADSGWRRGVVSHLAADFDGDGKADPAAYFSGNWYVWLSMSGYGRLGPFALGSAWATPVAADFDGDQLADPAVYDGTNWTEWLSGSGYAAQDPYPYSVSTMSAVAADFDGDGKADPAGWVLGDWYAWPSTFNYDRVGPFTIGAVMAAPVAADFDGDGIGDLAIYFPVSWTEWRSGTGYGETGPYSYGVAHSLPVAADFDGDGLADPAAVAGDDWTVWLSTAGYARYGPYSLPVSP